MYKIIGGDQKEYGPVSFDQLTAWVRDNRANGQTLIQKEGGPWVPMGSLPEFVAILGGPTASSGPVSGTGPTVFQQGTPPSGGGGYGGGYVPGGTGGMGARLPGGGSESVQGPATGLMITGILGAIAVLIGAAFGFMGAGNMANATGNMPPEMRQFMDMAKAFQSPAMIVVDTVVKLAVAGLIIFASSKLRKLESFPLVVTAAILAMVPCTSPCCCVGLPIGIWVLVAIMKPEVKSSFH